jgi:hypothetical protein
MTHTRRRIGGAGADGKGRGAFTVPSPQPGSYTIVSLLALSVNPRLNCSASRPKVASTARPLVAIVLPLIRRPVSPILVARGVRP